VYIKYIVYIYTMKAITKLNNMKTIIFKSEKNAKTYKEIALTSNGVYAKGEVIRTVKTDKIENLTNGMYQTTFEEVK
jgi:hypothetical protein